MTPAIAQVTSNRNEGMVESFVAHAAEIFRRTMVGFNASSDEKDLKEPNCEVLLYWCIKINVTC